MATKSRQWRNDAKARHSSNDDRSHWSRSAETEQRLTTDSGGDGSTRQRHLEEEAQLSQRLIGEVRPRWQPRAEAGPPGGGNSEAPAKRLGAASARGRSEPPEQAAEVRGRAAAMDASNGSVRR
ncbi:hypothetical protein TRIUR3_17759 [Triticum urartu]|uniref:Uncharacterized protein n=1 Tax=Triticum urartu TaxID=4572 RepID=M7YQ99_TRIUA|nr:hypothetical protein TRIUR3_17759 [Triticum urartu]